MSILIFVQKSRSNFEFLLWKLDNLYYHAIQDPTNSCSNLPNYPEALHSASGALVNGVPTICGGLDQTSSTGVVPNCYNFDKNMGKWTSFANITGKILKIKVGSNDNLFSWHFHTEG